MALRVLQLDDVRADWLRQAGRQFVDRARLFARTTAALLTRPHAFFHDWAEGAHRTQSPLAYFAASLGVLGPIVALLKSFAGISTPVFMAIFPYLEFVALGLLGHLALKPLTKTHPWPLSLAVALFAGGGPSALADVFAAAARFGVATSYEDGDFSWRISSGLVAGSRVDNTTVPALTNLAGLFGLASSHAPYQLPPRWLAAKDRLELNTPLAFTADTDCLFAQNGDDEGAALLNQQGHVVGMAYSTNQAGLGSEFRYDKDSRVIAVTASAILHVLERVYGAGALVSELQAP